MSTPQLHSRIRGTGSALPSRVLTNEDLERMVDTSDSWITTRTGIKERRIAEESDTLADYAAVVRAVPARPMLRQLAKLAIDGRKRRSP